LTGAASASIIAYKTGHKCGYHDGWLAGFEARCQGAAVEVPN
jgi:membrane carboxypeptidase/penicillin-binding protein PbpC